METICKKKISIDLENRNKITVVLFYQNEKDIIWF
jgi:hypothetical protein